MRLKFLLLNLFYRFLPIKKNTVFFISFEGLYNDNPKYISECLYRTKPELNIVWTCRDDMNDPLPPYVKAVKYRSREYFSYLNRAQVVVDNYTGLRSFGFLSRRVALLEKLVKRKGQLCISTWHGTPIKKIGKDIIQKKNAHYCSCSDYCVAGSRYTADILEQAYDFSGRTRLYGTPRNDVFFRENDVAALKEKLGLPSDKGIVLFAPTFRQSVDMSGVAQLKMMDIKGILEDCKNTFSRDFVFVFRVHHSVRERIDNECVIKGLEDFVIDGNIGDDMAEYLLCTDVLITDYSGSMFDFALTEKPCLLFAPDMEHYGGVERGFYRDYASLPFPIATELKELSDNIKSFNYALYQKGIKELLADMGDCEDGLASERIVKDIIEFLS